MTPRQVLVAMLCLAGMAGAACAQPAGNPPLEKKIRSLLDLRGTGAQSPGAPPAIQSQEKGPAETTAPKSMPPGLVVEGNTTPIGGRGYLGVILDDRNEGGRGVRILVVKPGSPGESSGLKAQDLITHVADMQVRQMSDLAAILREVNPGTKLVFSVQRDDERKKIEVTFGQRPEVPRDLFNETSPRTEEGKSQSLPSAGLLPPPSAFTRPALKGSDSLPSAPAGSLPIPPAPGANGSPNDRARIEGLERRLQQLEQRLEMLERALLDKR